MSKEYADGVKAVFECVAHDIDEVRERAGFGPEHPIIGIYQDGIAEIKAALSCYHSLPVRVWEASDGLQTAYDVGYTDAENGRPRRTEEERGR